MGRAHRSMVGMLALISLTAFSACDDDPAAPEGAATFTIEVSGEQFMVQVETDEQIQALQARMNAGTEGVLSGELLPGSGGFNEPWSWRMDPATVHTPDLAVEVCDGRPSMVEDNLDYWLETVGRFCPWGAKVVARTN